MVTSPDERRLFLTCVEKLAAMSDADLNVAHDFLQLIRQGPFPSLTQAQRVVRDFDGLFDALPKERRDRVLGVLRGAFVTQTSEARRA